MHLDTSKINAWRMSGLSCRTTLFYNRDHQGHRVISMRKPASILVVDHCIHDSCIWIASEARIKGSSTIIDMGCRLAMADCPDFLYCKKSVMQSKPLQSWWVGRSMHAMQNKSMWTSETMLAGEGRCRFDALHCNQCASYKPPVKVKVKWNNSSNQI